MADVLLIIDRPHASRCIEWYEVYDRIRDANNETLWELWHKTSVRTGWGRKHDVSDRIGVYKAKQLLEFCSLVSTDSKLETEQKRITDWGRDPQGYHLYSSTIMKLWEQSVPAAVRSVIKAAG